MTIHSVVSIPYTTLYSLLEKAENKQQKINGPDGKEEELLPGTRIKKRQMTPEEQLEDDDEAQFAMAQEKADRKAYNEDSAWGSKRTWR
ncbi:MAG: hypothetical protein M1839_002464 [Geoglossum umbratile]|nr:MAG: hypothetical protein M1839_002464 [Geoglossum umbratile]